VQRIWQDVPAATAILDRFLAHATIVQVTGESYRLTPAGESDRRLEAVHGAAAVDAENAPTAAWKTRRRVSHTAHRRSRTRDRLEKNRRYWVSVKSC